MPANSVFSGPMTSVFNAMRFDVEIFSHASAKTKQKKTESVMGFKIRTFMGRYQMKSWQ